MMKRLMNKKKYLAVLVPLLATTTVCAEGLKALDDEQMSAQTGQALLNLSYIAPTDAANIETTRSGGDNNTGFYKLGIEAEMELNANINKLQLGCGGVNNAVRADSCDIDIDNIALSGIPENPNYTAEDRTATSALLTNPFIEFAIKNPNSAAGREMVGFRLSAEKIAGLMTLGTNNNDINGVGVPNGINTFSGYVKTKEASGVAHTAPRVMTYSGDTGVGIPITGEVSGGLGFGNCGGLFNPCIDIGYESTEYNLNLSSTTAPFTMYSTAVSGTRMTKANLTGYGTVDQINFSGELTATVLNLLNLEKNVTGNITGLKTDITLEQSLGLIHALYLNNPMSVSLQSKQIQWPGASAVANQGWWMAFEDEVELGDLSPSAEVEISNQVLQQTIAGISQDLTDNPRKCGNLLTGCVGGSDLNVGNIPLNSTTLDFPLVNLPLTGQNFRPNCWGNLTFC